MSLTMTLAVALRMLRQLRRDPRTLVMLLVVPSFILTLLYWVFYSSPAKFQHIGGPLTGVFPFTLMFIVTSISMLRERMGGTLERMMSLPLGKLDLLAGYAIAFGIVGVVQVLVTSMVSFGMLDVPNAGAMWLVIVLAIGNALVGMSLGLLASAFARTEFQAVQFMPAIVFPQLVLCGMLAPPSSMPTWLDNIAHALPMTYAWDALSRVVTQGEGLGSGDVRLDVAVIAGTIIAALILGAATLKRRSV
ncbi:MAG: ABC transporter permease [Thermoleophilia bacterium]|nr:ABC transporter permease [Thermoleophilia bacterium]